MVVITSTYAKQRKGLEAAADVVMGVLREVDEFGGRGDDGLVASSGASSTSRRIDEKPLQHRTPTKHAQSPKILLMTMSNGGASSLTHLLHVLHSRLNRPLPIIGLICDSGPNKGTFWRNLQAVILSLPRRTVLQRALSVAFAWYIMIWLHAWVLLLGNENPARMYRRVIVDEKFVRLGRRESVGDDHSENEDDDRDGDNSGGRVEEDSRGKVVLFYSKEDKMCYWEDVRDFGDEARGKGWEVQDVLFEGSGHCQHLMKEPERYAEAVKTLWEEK